MQAQELLKYIRNPELLGKESIPELQKLVSDFPYFQSGHILLSLAAKKWDASVYQQSIKKTAIVVSNRSHLFELLHAREETPIREEAEVLANKVEQAETMDATPQNKEEPQQEDTFEKVEPLSQVPKVVEKVDEISVEKEIEKAVVNAIVEKQMLGADEKQEPEENQPQPTKFSEWLRYVNKANSKETGSQTEEFIKTKLEEERKLVEAPITKTKTAAKEKQKALIDRIIEVNPSLIRSKEDQKFFKSDQKAKESLLENEHLVTETLAQIYALQGNISKAVRAYEILSLKFPQKSVYFASLIQKLKNNQ
jgi:hypothetical protein